MPNHQFSTFYLNDTYFGINIETVQEVIRHRDTTPIPLAPPDICGLIDLRGQIVPVVDLQSRLGMQTDTFIRAIADENRYNIILRDDDDELVSLLVGDIGDVLELPDEDFEPPIASLQGAIRSFVSGAYKLDDRLLLILDPRRVLESGFRAEAQRRREGEEAI
ncbi:MAG: chemotaxis protein CheW [Xenococcaceae cyanobacterium]